MKYEKDILLKDGRKCRIRNGREEDARAVMDNFNNTHGQTDFLTSYPDESPLTLESEREYLKKKEESEYDVELVAEVDGIITGTAGVDRVGPYCKVKHRANFGISVDIAWWGLGIGRALTECCIECARKMDFEQLELDVVADNEKALSLYESVGFKEFGRNPKGFKSRCSGYQETVMMRLEL